MKRETLHFGLVTRFISPPQELGRDTRSTRRRPPNSLRLCCGGCVTGRSDRAPRDVTRRRRHGARRAGPGGCWVVDYPSPSRRRLPFPSGRCRGRTREGSSPPPPPPRCATLPPTCWPPSGVMHPPAPRTSRRSWTAWASRRTTTDSIRSLVS